MRQPPNKVPKPMAMWQASTTSVGTSSGVAKAVPF
jgi:hypothetical protein